ncbi:MAG: hypothetical protein V3V57_14675, partial [Spirochaetia bacterium]
FATLTDKNATEAGLSYRQLSMSLNDAEKKNSGGLYGRPIKIVMTLPKRVSLNGRKDCLKVTKTWLIFRLARA